MVRKGTKFKAALECEVRKRLSHDVAENSSICKGSWVQPFEQLGYVELEAVQACRALDSLPDTNPTFSLDAQ